MEPILISVKCNTGDGKTFQTPEKEDVEFHVHDSNIWVHTAHGWGFSIDKDTAIMLLEKIANRATKENDGRETYLTINIHDEVLAHKMAEILEIKVKEDKV
jgi:hypothetical protein